MTEMDWITLDYLEFFCQQNHLVIGCKHGDTEVWISPLGPHPSDLTSDQVRNILRESPRFELRRTLDEELDLATSHTLSRLELEQRIQRMMN